MSGAIPPLPNTPSWRGAHSRTGTTLPLPLQYYICRPMTSLASSQSPNNPLATALQMWRRKQVTSQNVRVWVTLWLTVGQSVSQSVSQSVLALSPSGSHDKILAVVKATAVLLSRGVFPNGRTGLSCNRLVFVCVGNMHVGYYFTSVLHVLSFL
jgi:hypothetical protein